MYILKEGKIINVSLSEDEGIIKATKTREQLLKEWDKPDLILRNIVYQLNRISDTGKGIYCFQIVTSQYEDNSNISYGHGIFKSKGEAIVNMLRNGFKVTNNDIEITE